MPIRPKKKCEICGFTNSSILHRHHVIPRKDPRSTNYNTNLAILCPNCHSLVHSGEYTISGIYQTSEGTEAIWFKKGSPPPFPKELWSVQDNPLVLTLKGEKDDFEGEEYWKKIL